MEIHRHLYGTRANGAYGEVKNSPELYHFLTTEIGAVSERAVLDKISVLFKPHKALEGYSRYRKEDIPVSTRYAPMHLRVLPEMPATILPFCAVGFAGYERRENSSVDGETNNLGRDTFYTMIQMFSCNLMYTSRKYNYLDYLFGLKPFTTDDVALVRNGVKDLSDEVYPSKVIPVMREADKAYVLAAVEDIYAGKDVLIRLEPKAFYNHRSKEILTQIYSMIQPRLAAEVGYASYQEPASIDAARKAWSVRIFVVPGEERSEVALNNMTVLDLATPLQRESTHMQRILNLWWSIAWDKRIAILEKLFQDTKNNFNDAAFFIERSNYVFNGIKELNAWKKQPPVSSMTSIETVKKELESHEAWQYIPWATETVCSVFAKHRVPIREYTAKACLQWYESSDGAAKKYYRGLYEIGKMLENHDSEGVATIVREGMNAKNDAKCNEKMADLKTTLEKEFSAQEAAFQDKLNAQQANYEARLTAERTACEEKLTAQQADFESLLEYQKNSFQTQLSKRENQLIAQKKAYEMQISAKMSGYESQVEAQKQEKIAQKKSLDDAYNANLSAQRLYYDRQLNAQKSVYEGKISALEKRATELSAALKTETDACKDLTVELEKLRSRVRELEEKNQNDFNEFEEKNDSEIQAKNQEKRKEIVKKTLLAVLGGGLAVSAIAGARKNQSTRK